METAQQQPASLTVLIAAGQLELHIALHVAPVSKQPFLTVSGRTLASYPMLFTHAELSKCYVQAGRDADAAWDLWIDSTCFGMNELPARLVAKRFSLRIQEHVK